MLSFIAKWIDRRTIRLAGLQMRKRSASTPRPYAEILAFDFSCKIVTASPEISFSSSAFQFKSEIVTPWEENNTVHGILFPCGENWRTKPTVILLHGWNAEYSYRWQFPGFAKRLRRAGINAVAIELPYHSQRRPNRDGAVNDFICDDIPSMIQATQQSLADIRSLARWLRAQGSPRVGLWGFSLGAWLAGLAICASDEFDFAALLTPVVKMDRAISDLDFCEPIRRALEQTKVPLDRLDLISHRPKIPTEKILLIESRHDVFVPAETVEELWRAWNQPEIWRVNHGHISALFSPDISKRGVNWIANKALAQTTESPSTR